MAEMPSEEDVLDSLEDRGIARPIEEHKRAGQPCLNPECDETVPENSHKKMNLGAPAGYCNVICLMEDEKRDGGDA